MEYCKGRRVVEVIDNEKAPFPSKVVKYMKIKHN